MNQCISSIATFWLTGIDDRKYEKARRFFLQQTQKKAKKTQIAEIGLVMSLMDQ